ncbi:MAG: CBU_0592 family membrane protein [Actinomycetes bacterium]
MHAVEQVIQVVGALLILIAFVLVQLGRLRPSTWNYLWLNFVGSTVLAVDALIGREIGFLLLEGVWAAVSLWSIGMKARGAEHGEIPH